MNLNSFCTGTVLSLCILSVGFLLSAQHSPPVTLHLTDPTTPNSSCTTHLWVWFNGQVYLLELLANGNINNSWVHYRRYSTLIVTAVLLFGVLSFSTYQMWLKRQSPRSCISSYMCKTSSVSQLMESLAQHGFSAEEKLPVDQGSLRDSSPQKLKLSSFIHYCDVPYNFFLLAWTNLRIAAIVIWGIHTRLKWISSLYGRCLKIRCTGTAKRLYTVNTVEFNWYWITTEYYQSPNHQHHLLVPLSPGGFQGQCHRHLSSLLKILRLILKKEKNLSWT